MSAKRRKIIAFLISFLLIFQQSGFAQVAGELNIAAHLAALHSNIIQDKFRPLHLRYLSYDTQANNFKLLLDKGSLKDLNNQLLEDTTKDLLKYFFIGISLPNDSFWVNLRPDSPDNIIDDWLAQTDVGKIMLEADLQLKKDTAKATSPETPEGKLYWDKLYKKAEELFGNENITIPTLSRPWIVPGEIIIRETMDDGRGTQSLASAYIYKATLKVMLEQDYLKESATYNFKDPRLKALNEYSSQLIRELIIPKLTKEVNTSKRYAPLRQVYYSLILASWFKARFKGLSPQKANSSYQGTVLALIDSHNLANLTSQDNWSKSTYFKAYQENFKQGEYNIQEPIYTPYGQSIRSYFSGGIAGMQPAVIPERGGLDVTEPTGGSVRVVPAATQAAVETEYGISVEYNGGLVHIMAKGVEENIPTRERRRPKESLEDYLKRLREKYDVNITVVNSQEELNSLASERGLTGSIGNGFGYFDRKNNQAYVFILKGYETDERLLFHEITEALARQSIGVAEAGANSLEEASAASPASVRKKTELVLWENIQISWEEKLSILRKRFEAAVEATHQQYPRFLGVILEPKESKGFKSILYRPIVDHYDATKEDMFLIWDMEAFFESQFPKLRQLIETPWRRKIQRVVHTSTGIYSLTDRATLKTALPNQTALSNIITVPDPEVRSFLEQVALAKSVEEITPHLYEQQLIAKNGEAERFWQQKIQQAEERRDKDPVLNEIMSRRPKLDISFPLDMLGQLREKGLSFSTSKFRRQLDKTKARVPVRLIRDGYVYLFRGDYRGRELRGIVSFEYYHKNLTLDEFLEADKDRKPRPHWHFDPKSILEEEMFLHGNRGYGPFLSATEYFDTAKLHPYDVSDADKVVYVLRVPLERVFRNYANRSETKMGIGYELEYLIPDYITPTEIIEVIDPRLVIASQNYTIEKYLRGERLTVISSPLQHDANRAVNSPANIQDTINRDIVTLTDTSSSFSERIGALYRLRDFLLKGYRVPIDVFRTALSDPEDMVRTEAAVVLMSLEKEKIEGFYSWLQGQRLFQKSVITVRSKNGVGSGFAVAEDEKYVYLMSAGHVVKESPEITVIVGSKEAQKECVGEVIVSTPKVSPGSFDFALAVVKKYELYQKGIRLIPLRMPDALESERIIGEYVAVVSGYYQTTRAGSIVHTSKEQITASYVSDSDEGDSGAPLVMRVNNEPVVVGVHLGPFIFHSNLSLAIENRKNIFGLLSRAISLNETLNEAGFAVINPVLIPRALVALGYASTLAPSATSGSKTSSSDGLTSSPLVSVKELEPGGIDFRSLPIVTQAIGNLSANINAQAINRLSALDLNQELQSIQRMVSSGITPSSERIKEYIQAACFEEDSTQDLDKVILCISDILRQEEENCCSTDPMLKDILVVLDSVNSPSELKSIFLGLKS